MNKYMTTLFFIIVALTVPFSESLADDTVLDTTVVPFLTALQSGDTESLQSYAGGPLYENIIEATGQNEDYGAFLRQRYAEATFYPGVVQQDESSMVVSVKVDFAGEGSSVFELLIEKNSAGSWRIVDQYSPAKTL